MLRVINNVFFNTGFRAPANSGIKAGMIVAITGDAEGQPVLKRAQRNVDGLRELVGIAGDDATSVGNTMGIIDPVTLEYQAKPARRIGDFMDETITNTKNWTDHPSEPMRGVTIFSVGGEFGTDQFVSDASANAAGTDGGAAPTLVVGSVMLYGATDDNAGLLIEKGTVNPTGLLPAVGIVNGPVSNGILPFKYEVITTTV